MQFFQRFLSPGISNAEFQRPILCQIPHTREDPVSPEQGREQIGGGILAAQGCAIGIVHPVSVRIIEGKTCKSLFIFLHGLRYLINSHSLQPIHPPAVGKVVGPLPGHNGQSVDQTVIQHQAPGACGITFLQVTHKFRHTLFNQLRRHAAQHSLFQIGTVHGITVAVEDIRNLPGCQPGIQDIPVASDLYGLYLELQTRNQRIQIVQCLVFLVHRSIHRYGQSHLPGLLLIRSFTLGGFLGLCAGTLLHFR